MDSLPRSSVIAAAAFGGLVFYYALSLTRGKRLPPGPRRLPVIGNVHQMPVESPWMAFSEWGKTYGALTSSLTSLASIYLAFAPRPSR